MGMAVKLERQPTRTPLDALSLAKANTHERRMGEGGGHSIALRHLGEGENDRPPPRDDGNRPRIRLASHQTLTPYPHFGKVYTWRKKLQLIY